MFRLWLVLLITLIFIPKNTLRTDKLALTQRNQKYIKKFRVLVLYQNGGHHILYSQRARIWLDKLAADSNFSIDYIQNTANINDRFLDKFRLFIQLDYPPYGWSAEASAAFQHYMEKGKGGWIGFHHASLIGDFDGYPVWGWYRDFMGGIRWKDYIAGFADARVIVEDTLNPCMKDVPRSFIVQREEWYTYDSCPGPNVHTIAIVNESSYNPLSGIKMGYHPVIWTNRKIAAKNIYIFMGHSPDLFENKIYTSIFRNAIFWASGKEQ
jgi:uncharacterized protein